MSPALLGTKGRRTEDVDRLQVRRDAVKERFDLLLVPDIELHGGELASGLYARFLVRGDTCFLDLLQLVDSTRREDDVRAGLTLFMSDYMRLSRRLAYLGEEDSCCLCMDQYKIS